MKEGLSIKMPKRYVDMTSEELIGELHRIDNSKSERVYFALGALIGVFGNIAVNTLIELLNVTRESQLYTLLTIGSVILLLAFLYLTHDKNSDDNIRKEVINKILQRRRRY